MLSYRSSFLHERNWQDRGFVYNSSGCLELNEIPTCSQKLKRIKCLPYPWLVIHSVGLQQFSSCFSIYFIMIQSTSNNCEGQIHSHQPQKLYQSLNMAVGTSSQKENPYLLSPDAQIWHFWNTYLLKLKASKENGVFCYGLQ